jgi:leucyl/phenylalanyl-tRNA--protein transferase
MLFRLNKELVFPDPSLAEPDGLLAIGGDLSPERLMLAYRNAIFPWPIAGQPLLWFSPHERFVLFPGNLKVSSSMRKQMRKHVFEITTNQAFEEVIHACAKTKRSKQRGTWITADMEKAYIRLHLLGVAHSVEVWTDRKLVGGMYGVACDQVFCAESMFSLVSNASKAALISFVQNTSYTLIDCQVHSAHLESLGAGMISREEYLKTLHTENNEKGA